MARRLTANALPLTERPRFSEPTALGTIQLPPDGQPIVLLNERQTIGGYPTLGCVYQLDCFALAQRRPGQGVYFIQGDVQSAQRLLKEFLNVFTV